jgi:hypothetical protein
VHGVNSGGVQKRVHHITLTVSLKRSIKSVWGVSDGNVRQWAATRLSHLTHASRNGQPEDTAHPLPELN